MTQDNHQNGDDTSSLPLPSDALKKYREEIEQSVPLTDEGTRLLFQKLKYAKTNKEKQKIKEKIMEGYLAFVVDIAESFTEIELILVDYIQEGNMGLLSAIDAYDYGQKKSFLDFCTPHIYDTIQAYIQENPAPVQEVIRFIPKDSTEEEE